MLTGAAEHQDTHLRALGLRRLMLSVEHCRQVLARELDLGTRDLEALLHLATEGPLTPHQLAIRMEMTSGTMTALLDRVEKAGLLLRQNNPRDRRSLFISVTPAGQAAARRVDDDFDAVLTEALAEVPHLALDQVEAILAVLSQALEGRARLRSRV